MEPVENAVGYTIFTVGSLFNRGGLGVVHAAPEPPGTDSLPDSTRRFPTRPGFVRWVLGVPAAPGSRALWRLGSMLMSQLVAAWDLLHVKNTGDIGFFDLAAALELAGVELENDLPGNQSKAPVPDGEGRGS